MTFQNFISRLNWRQMLIHFIAFWFFIHAFQTLSYLYDTKLVEILRDSKGQVANKTFADNGIAASDLTYFILWTNVSGFIGLFVAFIISLTISIRRHWFWVNALIAFIVTYLLYKFDLLGWTHLKPFLWFPGQKFDNATVGFLLNGIVLLALGLLVFFLKRPNQFIENNKLTATTH